MAGQIERLRRPVTFRFLRIGGCRDLGRSGEPRRWRCWRSLSEKWSETPERWRTPPYQPIEGNPWQNFAAPPPQPKSTIKGDASSEIFGQAGQPWGGGLGERGNWTRPPPPTHTLEGDPWPNFCRDPGTPTIRGKNPGKRSQPGPTKQAPTQATIPTSPSPSCMPRSIGGNPLETLSFPCSGGTSSTASQELTIRIQLRMAPSGLNT